MNKKLLVGMVAVIIIAGAASAWYFMGGQGGGAEEVVNVAVTVRTEADKSYIFNLRIRNAGDAQVRLVPTSFLICGKNAEGWANRTTTPIEMGYTDVILEKGDTLNVQLAVLISEVQELIEGDEAELTVRTKSGKEFTNTVKLPA